jgi:hypothetical protein
LVGEKIMVNGNHFQFNRKNLFNFLKTKSFYEFKLFILVHMFVKIFRHH